MKVGIIGAGSWGTALAKIAGVNADEVHLWVREDELRDEIRRQRTNELFLPGVILPPHVHPEQHFEAFASCDFVILAVPSGYLRQIAEQLRPHLRPGTPIVNAAKGLEFSTNKRLSTVLREALQDSHPIVVLSGPNIALEVGKGVPSAAVVAADDAAVATAAQRLLMTETFRVYTNRDLVGVELGGALKNIIAFAAGVLDGLQYGDNTKAALMTRGMTEMVRLGRAMGAEITTFAGLSGMGDLIVTCTSPHSRNRRAGFAIGQGHSLDSVQGGTRMVIEGVNTTRAAHVLAAQHGVIMPITTALHEVLFQQRSPREAVMELMTRDRKSEAEDYLSPYA